jgi:hypothetical protein
MSRGAKQLRGLRIEIRGVYTVNVVIRLKSWTPCDLAKVLENRDNIWYDIRFAENVNFYNL